VPKTVDLCWVPVTRPLVSIVTPSYNQGAFLEETIRSVLEQDYEPIEYVVLDDGSTDDSLDIIQRYSERLSRWEVRANSGQAAALNAGLQQAQGELLGFVNSDDTLLPGAVSKLVAEFERDPQLWLVYGDAVYTDEHSRQTGPLTSREFDVVSMVRECDNHVVQPSSLWHRRAWEELGPFDEDAWYFFDFQFFLQFPPERVKRLAAPLATYRIHARAKSTGADAARLAGDHERLARTFFAGDRLPESARSAARPGRASAYLLGAEFAYEGLDLRRARRYVLRAVALQPSRLFAPRWASLLAKSTLPRSFVRRARARRRSR